MTLREIFKKVQTYNEVAELMYSQPAAVHFYDRGCFSGEKFSDYKSLSKYIRKTYFKEPADIILNCADYTIDEGKTFTWVDAFGDEITIDVIFELVAA